MKDKTELRIKEENLYDAMGEGENPIIRGKLDAIGFLLGETDPITDDDMEPPTTDDELDKLIAILEAEIEDIPEYSAFGDPNWQIYGAQIEICKWAKGE